MADFDVEEAELLLGSGSLNCQELTRCSPRRAAVPILVTVLAVALLWRHGHSEPQVAEDMGSAIQKFSEIKQCLPCHEEECQLHPDGHWMSCPSDKPYFSEGHCKCVSDKACYDDAPRVSYCHVCENCYKKPCDIAGQMVKCAENTPYYNTEFGGTCVSSCAPPPMPMANFSWHSGLDDSGHDSGLDEPLTCPRNTHGSCSFMGCAAWRNAKCQSSECMCEAGSCASRGKCVPSATFHANPTCGHNTFRSCGIWGCDRSLGEAYCDHPLAGAGTFKCLCKDNYCYDPDKSACVESR
mmetsp:Transcript_105968/g.252854  ORF Transcript_105968/g.252854 Transcript_105968/m.252854 type:complete len:296 (+) Transcript_105968:69-956(+)|eukprot:CAMPEP_0181451566 /NCGR_PEP_ID=MMETSP1110-20121109/28758_1 /TAXON_ID=174948 /ORGANISM="Symbiodinium sp., Strain CCMP421" /LENGTH=295 /DNA_ID=CAMNT_0023575823 /DNA_START=57 /DNA_END=944 /DNA_ORIENTATION=-